MQGCVSVMPSHVIEDEIRLKFPAVAAAYRITTSYGKSNVFLQSKPGAPVDDLFIIIRRTRRSYRCSYHNKDMIVFEYFECESYKDVCGWIYHTFTKYHKPWINPGKEYLL